MADTQPTITIYSIPGGQFIVNEAALPFGSAPDASRAQGGFTFKIAAQDGVRDLTVGGYIAIRDGVFTPGGVNLDYGRLSVTSYNAATGEVSVSFAMTGAYKNSPSQGPTRYGDIVSQPVVVTDADGDQASSNFLFQIRDDEGLNATGDSATVASGGTVSGNLVTGGTPDTFGADGFGGVFGISSSFASGGDFTFDAQGQLVLQGRHGVLTVSVNGDYTYTANSGITEVTGDIFSYHVRDGDGDTDVGSLGLTIQPTPSSSSQGQVLTSDQYADVLTGGAGADTLYAGQGPDQLTGGGGADVYAFRDLPWNAGFVTDFADGQDKIDLTALYSAHGYTGSDAVADRWVSFESDGAGGTKVFFDTDGPGAAQSWSFLITTLKGVAPGALSNADLVGGASSPPPASGGGETQPSSEGQVLTFDQHGDTLAGGAGNDTLYASQGRDQLTGGDGADRFVFAKTPWNAGVITDFQDGADKIDLSAIFDAMGYQGTDPLADGVMTLQAENGATKVYVDIDGAGGDWPFLITHLTGVAPSSLSAADFIL